MPATRPLLGAHFSMGLNLIHMALSSSLLDRQIAPSELLQLEAEEAFVLPAVGTLVSVSIDVCRTLGGDCSSTVLQHCKELSSRRYVALLENIKPPQTFDSLSCCRLRFLFQGNPSSSPADAIGPNMVVPLWTTAAAKPCPSRRRGIQPSRRLPFENCYFSSFISAVVLCNGASLVDADQRTVVSTRDMNSLRFAMLEDFRSRDRALEGIATEPPLLEVPLAANQLPARAAFAYEREDNPIVVNLSFELCTLPTISDPSTFFADAMFLIRAKTGDPLDDYSSGTQSPTTAFTNSHEDLLFTIPSPNRALRLARSFDEPMPSPTSILQRSETIATSNSLPLPRTFVLPLKRRSLKARTSLETESSRFSMQTKTEEKSFSHHPGHRRVTFSLWLRRKLCCSTSDQTAD
ncbi:hypothetical protein DL96DRAFT_12652 [Flagelloscypha sp. PMI_526]|nr:hypothetical protein DL96DRAFT_12652 [Flagelloscypha sp. PMI_526]